MSNKKSPPNSPRISVMITVKLPPGYRAAGNRIEVDPVQAKRIVALFQNYAHSR